jgi:protein SCO1
MITRRGLLAGLTVAPFARAGLLRAETTPAVSPDSSSIPPRPAFPPPPSGREMLRQRYFPNLELTTSDGRTVKFYDDLLKDKIVVLNLMYAQCNGICPATTSNLKRVRSILRQEIAHDVFIYSMTIKPEEDSPQALAAYARMHRIEDPQWLFLTGKPEDVDLLRHKLGFADPNPELDKDKSRHSGMLRYGNEHTAVWGTCQSSAEPEWIAQEIGFAIPREFKRHPRVNE